MLWGYGEPGVFCLAKAELFGTLNRSCALQSQYDLSDCFIDRKSLFEAYIAECSFLVCVFVHVCNSGVLLQRVLVVVCASRRGSGVCGHLLQTSQVHRCIEQRENVRVEGLPVWVVEVVLLGLQDLLAVYP